MEINGINDDIIPSAYYNSPIYSDVTLMGNDSSVGIPCHKIILGYYSEYFKKLFNSAFIEKDKREITIKTFSYYWLNKFIKFIYCKVLLCNYDEFDEMLAYGSFLMLKDKLNELCDQPCHAQNLIEINGYNKMMTLTETYNLTECAKIVFLDILEKRDTNILLSLSPETFKEIMSLISPPIDYSDELGKKCTTCGADSNQNITVINGKCFGNIPIVNAIYVSSFINNGIPKVKTLRRLNIKNRFPTSSFGTIITSKIMRGGITTVTVNYSEHDLLLNNATRYILNRQCSVECEIFSPNENICVIISYHNSGDMSSSCFAYSNIDGQQTYVPYVPDEHWSRYQVHIALSLTDIYYVTVRPYRSGRCQFECLIIDINTRTVKRQLHILLATQCYFKKYRIRDIIYGNNLLHILTTLNHYTTIVLIEPYSEQIVREISLPHHHEYYSLLSFGNVVYCCIKDVLQRTIELFEIQDCKLKQLNIVFPINIGDERFIITGSYPNNSTIREILQRAVT